MRRIARTVARAPVLSALLALAVLATVGFGLRLGVSTLRWSDPAVHDQPIAGWMTPRYVARSWEVPPEVVAEALALGRDGSGRRVTLEALAAQRGVSVASLAAALAAAIDASRQGRP